MLYMEDSLKMFLNCNNFFIHTINTIYLLPIYMQFRKDIYKNEAIKVYRHLLYNINAIY